MIYNTKKVGILATGDELITGDILNTNSQYFRQVLIEHAMTPGQEILVSDNTDEICSAIQFLLTTHDALITIGGLGPTADDKTRFGLAQALGLPLEFNEHAWQWVVELLQAKQLKIPDTNRQQALLPKTGEAIYNPNGTACACYLNTKGKDIYMLPGPPNECRPLFNTVVLNTLIDKNYGQPTYKKSWLLFGVSESEMASTLDPLVASDARCELGFRVQYPYLEVKLSSQRKPDLDRVVTQINALILDKTISHHRQTASEQLRARLTHATQRLCINDQATGGLLQTTLLTPHTCGHLRFEQDGQADLTITIKGLVQYWQAKQTSPRMPLSLTFTTKNGTHTLNQTVPDRGQRTPYYAVELICLKLMHHLGGQSAPAK